MSTGHCIIIPVPCTWANYTVSCYVYMILVHCFLFPLRWTWAQYTVSCFLYGEHQCSTLFPVSFTVNMSALHCFLFPLRWTWVQYTVSCFLYDKHERSTLFHVFCSVYEGSFYYTVYIATVYCTLDMGTHTVCTLCFVYSRTATLHILLCTA